MNEMQKGYEDRFAMVHYDQLDVLREKCRPITTVVFVWMIRRANSADNTCFPSLNTIARESGVGRSTVKRAIEELVAAGLLRVTRRKNKAGDRDSNLYTVLRPSMTTENPGGSTENPGGSTVDLGGSTENPQVGPQRTHGVGPQWTPNYTHGELDEGELDSSADAEARAADAGDANTPEPEGEDSQMDPSGDVGGSRKELPAHGPAQTIVKRFCEVLDIENPVGYRKMVGQAQQLAKAGYTPDDVEAIIRWLLADTYWVERGIDLGVVLSQANRWKAAQAASQKQPRRKRYVVNSRTGVPIG